jgi:Mg-chelatase subunit ChlD
VAVDSTIRAALLRRGLNKTADAFSITPQDLRKKIFKRPRKNLIIFVVDASDSMGQGTFARMKAAKGAALAILAKARLGRHRIAMVAFRDKFAEVVLQPTASLSLAQKSLKTLATGGATPFAHGLMRAWKMVKTERVKDPEIKPLFVVISDGEANVPYESRKKTTEVMAELFFIAEKIGRDRIASLVIDTKPPWEKTADMEKLSESLGGTYHHLYSLKAKNVVAFIAEAGSPPI